MASLTPTDIDDETIVAFDVGARFGIHPSWHQLSRSRLLATYAFEPDLHEVERLEKKYEHNERYHIFQMAFGETNDRKPLNLLAHKGQSSFLKPDLDGAWFGVTRQSEGRVESTAECMMRRMDDWCGETGVYPDFLKTDTEGYDYFVLEGAERLIKEKLLGIRCEVLFQQTFIGTREFDRIFRLLRQHDYVLANLDYDGKGSAQSYFCPNPRFGLLTGCEAVFIRDEGFYMDLAPAGFLKSVIFLFLNNLADVAVPYMQKRRDLFGSASTPAHASLSDAIERLFLVAAKKLQAQPGSNFDRARHDFEELFTKSFPDKHRFFESEILNPA